MRKFRVAKSRRPIKLLSKCSGDAKLVLQICWLGNWQKQINDKEICSEDLNHKISVKMIHEKTSFDVYLMYLGQSKTSDLVTVTFCLI